jgi:WD40 repeat protein
MVAASHDSSFPTGLLICGGSYISALGAETMHSRHLGRDAPQSCMIACDIPACIGHRILYTLLKRLWHRSSVFEIQDLLSVFFDNHLLRWFECLSALRQLKSSVKSLDNTKEAISVSSKLVWNKNINKPFPQVFARKHGGFEGILLLLDEARRFLRFAFEAIDGHPLETYRSALVWIPEKSSMRERYADMFRGAPQVLYGLSESWDPVLRVMTHSHTVTSINFSPEGNRIVSGSRDNCVRIWNIASGEQEVKLDGHTLIVTSVAFSVDGTHIASGSEDYTLQIKRRTIWVV